MAWQEYGITADEKRVIGARVCHHLLRKIMFDLTAVSAVTLGITARGGEWLLL